MDADGKTLMSNVRNSRWSDTVLEPLDIEKIGLYSVSKERMYDKNAENLKYYYVPKDFPLDLDMGYGTALQKDLDENLYLNHILMYIKDNQKVLIERSDLPDKPNRLKADVVSYRGTLRLIMCTPYDMLNEWRVLVSKFNGTIYIMCENTPQQKMELLNRSDEYKRMRAWGHKFEQYCVTNAFHEPPNIEEPVDECSELHCIIKTSINGRTHIYSAEMDGIDSSKPVTEITKQTLGSLRFIELKTKRKRLTSRQTDSYYRHKTREWWLQSYLSGINEIFVGLRDERGSVEEIQKISTENLLNEATQRGYWSGSACFKFLDTFNNQVAKMMDDITDPNTVLQLDYNCGTQTVTYEVLHGKTSKSFLPIWYQNIFKK